jgi:hypothetical protein
VAENFDNVEDEDYYEVLEEHQASSPTHQKILREWAFINALRDVLGLSLKGSKTVSYLEVIAFGANIAPAILGPDRILFGDERLNLLYQEYKERAAALSYNEKRDVPIIEAVDRSINEYMPLIRTGREMGLNTLNRKFRDLHKLRKELETSSHTENNLIIRDIYKVKRDLPFEDGKDYRDFKINEDRGLRIRVLHPDQLEHITGADLVYENYWEQNQKVRVAAVQYKIRRNNSIYINPRINNQLSRLEKTFCHKNFCQLTNDKHKKIYRLPYCAAFLRPTDEVQPNDARIMSKGYYVPICVVKEVRDEKCKNPNIIPSNILRSQAITHKNFEELFNANMLGSEWKSYAELEEIYNSTGLLLSNDSITIHAQEFSLKSKPRKGQSTSKIRHVITSNEETTDEIPDF